MLLSLALASVIGLLLGLLGGGGSILTVPVLVYVAGIPPKSAIAMSLPVVGITSLVGALGHWRAGNVHVRVALFFGVIAMIGAYLGARLAIFLTGALQLTLLAIVMLAAAASMLRDRSHVAAVGERGDGDAWPGAPARRILAPAALGVGVLTGLVGIGGGFLIVPALVLLARLPMKAAVGTSLLVITMNSASGFVGHVDHTPIRWAFLSGFTSVAVAGIVAGTYLLRFASQLALRRAFAILLVIMSVFVLYQNRHTFHAPLATPHPAATSATSRSEAEPMRR